MFDNLNLGDWQSALKMTGSDYEIPESVSQQPPMPSTEDEMPADGAPAEDWARYADKTNELSQYPGLKNSPIVGLAKKVVGAVASFYTGGAAGLAMNVGSQVVGKNNPKATAAAGMASKLFGG